MKSPIDIIAENLPTYADCYKQPVEITVPSIHRVTKDAANIIAALAAEGFEIVRAEQQAP